MSHLSLLAFCVEFPHDVGNHVTESEIANSELKCTQTNKNSITDRGLDEIKVKVKCNAVEQYLIFFKTRSKLFGQFNKKV